MRIAALALIVTFAAAACQPLYGGAAEPKARVKPIIHVAEPPLPPPVYYNDECVGNFHDDPRRAPPAQPALAAKLADEADKTMTEANAKPPSREQGTTYVTAVDRYSAALRKDPYNADITLRLALAYDKVYHRACAIVLLKRIAKLTTNPKVSPNAESVAASVEDNTSMFKGYRKDAVAALARP